MNTGLFKEPQKHCKNQNKNGRLERQTGGGLDGAKRGQVQMIGRTVSERIGDAVGVVWRVLECGVGEQTG